MNYYVYVKDILGVSTNVKDFKWSYGTVAPEANKSDFDRCLIKVDLQVVDDNNVFDASIKNESGIGKYHYFFGSKGCSRIYYERDFFFGAKLLYMIDIMDNCIFVKVNRNYYKFISHRFMNLHSISYILTDLVSGILLRNGLATIHCSAVNVDGRTFVLFAPPNTGKTLTVMKLCELDGARFIAEDFAITDGNNIFAVPWTSTFRYYDDINRSKVDRFMNSIKKKLPILELVSLSKSKAIEEYIGKDRVLNRIEITDVVVLERGNTEIIGRRNDILQKVINLNKYEFNYHKSPAVLVLNYFNPQFSIDEMYDTEKRILKNLIDKHSVNIVVSNDAKDYASLIVHSLLR